MQSSKLHQKKNKTNHSVARSSLLLANSANALVIGALIAFVADFSVAIAFVKKDRLIIALQR